MGHAHEPLSDRRPTPTGTIDRREALRRIALATFAVPGSAAAWTAWLGGALPCAAAARVPAMLQPVVTLKASLDWTVPAADPLTAIKIILSGLLGEIPVVGWALDVLLDLFWPTPRPGDPPLPDLWSMIKDQLQALINEDIDTYYSGELNNDIAGLRGALDNYRRAAAAASVPNGARPHPEIIQNLIAYAAAVQTTFTTLMPRFTGRSADTAWKVLPLYVQAANLHLAFLADIIRNGSEYWLDPGVIANYTPHWHAAMDPDNTDSGTGYVHFVMATLQQANHQFASDYQNSKANWAGVNPTGDYGYATATPFAWQGRKAQNAKSGQYTLTVKDFVDVWKGLQDPSQPIDPDHLPTVLDRVLWYGPYGAPDGRDIGLQFRYHKVHNDLYTIDVPVTVLAGTLEVPTPPATPDAALGAIHFGLLSYTPVSTEGNPGPITPRGANIVWTVPTEFSLQRGGTLPAPSAFNMTIDAANPVVSVKVHTCDYTSGWNKTDIGGSGVVAATNWSGGTLVGGIEFVRADNTSALVGLGEQATRNCCDGTVYEITGNATESLAVAGHILCDLYRPSAVYQLWANVGTGPWTTGSMMFAFRLRDPMLTPPASLLARAYVSSPLPLSAGAIAELAAAWYRRRGSELSDEALVELGAILLGIIEEEGLDAEREAYWNAVAVFVEAHTPSGSRQLPRLGNGTSPHVGRPVSAY
jgi:hypothetical protein